MSAETPTAARREPAPPLDQEWFVHVAEQTKGPYTGHEISALIDSRDIARTDLVYPVNGSAWIRADDDPIITTLFPKTPTPQNPSPTKRQRPRRYSVWVLACVPLVLVTCWTIWPYWSVFELITAIRDGDANALEHLVSWDSVRRGLRDDLNAVLLKNISAGSGGGNQNGAPLSNLLGATLGPAITNQIIDGYVTPQAIAALVQNERLNKTGSDRKPSTPTAPLQAVRDFRLDRIKYAFFSGSPFSFRVDVALEGEALQPSLFSLKFDWVGNWKLSRVEMPLEEMGKDFAAFKKTFTNKLAGNGSNARESPSSSPAKTTPQPVLSEQPSSDLAPLTLRLVNKAFRDANPKAMEYQSFITMELEIKNVSDKDIRAFDGVLTFTDLLDNEIKSSKIAINQLIRAGTNLRWSGSLEYNQFMDEHRRFKEMTQDNLKMKFSPRKILFADGSIKEYGN